MYLTGAPYRRRRYQLILSQESRAAPAFRCLAFQARLASARVTLCAQEFDLRGGPLLEHYQIALICFKGDDFLRSEAATKCFEGPWKSIPIETTGRVLKIPTGEILVKFKEGLSSSEVEGILASFELRIVAWPTKLTPAYKVTDQPRSAAHSLETAAQLGKLSLIEYAEPNWVIIRRDEAHRPK